MPTPGKRTRLPLALVGALAFLLIASLPSLLGAWPQVLLLVWPDLLVGALAAGGAVYLTLAGRLWSRRFTWRRAIFFPVALSGVLVAFLCSKTGWFVPIMDCGTCLFSFLDEGLVEHLIYWWGWEEFVVFVAGVGLYEVFYIRAGSRGVARRWASR